MTMRQESITTARGSGRASGKGNADLALDSVRLRRAAVEDLNAIADIWRKGITASLGFDAGFPDIEGYFRECLREESDTSKFWVAKSREGKVIGWQSLRPTRANPILRNLVAESSTYVDLDCGLHGVGTALIHAATRHADASALLYITGYITDGNGAMRSIVSKAGWIEIGKVPSSAKSPRAPEASFWIYVAKDGT
jgi:L-amino acid N-acyltransferase YncA